MVNSWEAVTELLSVGLIAGIGAYFGSYLKAKGKNLATKEDVAELTRTTKDIEAKISGRLWDSQRRWEMKRDVLFEAARKFANLTDCLMALNAEFFADEKSIQRDSPERLAIRKQSYSDFNEAAKDLHQVALLVNIVCKETTAKLLTQFSVFSGTVAKDIAVRVPDAFNKSARQLAEAQLLIPAAIRGELEAEQTN
jgi:hypothetical protein